MVGRRRTDESLSILSAPCDARNAISFAMYQLTNVVSSLRGPVAMRCKMISTVGPYLHSTGAAGSAGAADVLLWARRGARCGGLVVGAAGDDERGLGAVGD